MTTDSSSAFLPPAPASLSLRASASSATTSPVNPRCTTFTQLPVHHYSRHTNRSAALRMTMSPSKTPDTQSDKEIAPSTKLYSSDEAERTILKRGLIQDSNVPPHIQERIDAMFDNKPTTPFECVQAILKSIAENGDEALSSWTSRIDRADISKGSEVSHQDIQASLTRVDPNVVQSLRKARDRVLQFHKEQPMSSWFTSSLGGVVGQAIRPIERIGFYVPGGTAPLPSTVIMSVIPAIVAGCEKLVVVSPPLKDSHSGMADVTLAAIAVINELEQVKQKIRVFTIGGAQAIGALAYGTETVPQVDKIVGPGNIFVSIAKREVFGIVGIDGIYGPTEAVVVADDSANPKLVAADLLAQAEHDWLAIPILITNNMQLAEQVQVEIDRQIVQLPRENVARHSMEHQGGIVVCDNMDECLRLANNFATEHVSLSVKNPWDILGKVKNAGGVFMGEGSCEVLGDYIAGPSHVMPTGGSARYSSPLSVMDFIKIISVVGLDAATVRDISVDAEAIARAEGLDGHGNAAMMRRDFEQ